MTTSKKKLVALQFPFFENDYEKNLKTLTSLINKAPDNAIVTAPELCLTNFSFDKLNEASEFSSFAKKEILKLSEKKVISLSMCEKIGENFYNSAKIFYKGKEIHSQPKVKLFAFGDEEKHFSPGSEENIKIVEIDGLRYGILICFEIRFIRFWLKLQGADIIMIPALWGKLRKEQLVAITKSLAIINQAFVILSDSANDDMAKSSGIITPFGKEYRNDESSYISYNADLNEIKKMRRYMDIGLK